MKFRKKNHSHEDRKFLTFAYLSPTEQVLSFRLLSRQNGTENQLEVKKGEGWYMLTHWKLELK